MGELFCNSSETSFKNTTCDVFRVGKCVRPYLPLVDAMCLTLPSLSPFGWCTVFDSAVLIFVCLMHCVWLCRLIRGHTLHLFPHQEVIVSYMRVPCICLMHLAIPSSGQYPLGWTLYWHRSPQDSQPQTLCCFTSGESLCISMVASNTIIWALWLNGRRTSSNCVFLQWYLKFALLWEATNVCILSSSL